MAENATTTSTNQMEGVSIGIITRSERLPEMSEKNFFHSPELFRIVEQTRGQTPYMVVALRGERVVAHLLAIVRRRGSLIPPYLFTQGRVYGEGEYDDGEPRELLFSKMLQAISRKLHRRLCFYIEFSDLSTKMFGYRYFRQQGYFPVHWMEIHNSLHSMPPEQRLNDKMLERIRRGYEQGVVTKRVDDYDDFRDFYKMMRRYFKMKMRRFLPPERMFFELGKSERCRLFVTQYKHKVIGSCACVYSGGNAYLWYMASQRKRHPLLHPDAMTVWNALKEAHGEGLRHFYFMDVGLPYRRNPQREFILSFGGKPVGTYRWFNFTFSWMNKIISWFYRE